VTTGSAERQRYVARRRERPPGNRVLVGLPLLEQVYAEFMVNFMSLGVPFDRLIPITAAYVQQAHNEIVRQALQRRDWEYLLMLEHDHLLPSNLLQRVAGYSEPVVGALYFLRRPPHNPCALIPADGHDDPGTWAGLWEYERVQWLNPGRTVQAIEEGRLYRVCAVGMGCTAIRRDVLEAFGAELPFQVPYEGGDLLSDDVWFCRRAAQLGFEVYLDGGLVLPHLAVRPVHVDTHFEHLERRARELGLVEAPAG